MSPYQAALMLIRASDQYRMLWRAGRETPYDVEHVASARAAWDGRPWSRDTNRWGKVRIR